MTALDERCRCGAFIVAKLPDAQALMILGAFRLQHVGEGHGPADRRTGTLADAVRKLNPDIDELARAESEVRP